MGEQSTRITDDVTVEVNGEVVYDSRGERERDFLLTSPHSIETINCEDTSTAHEAAHEALRAHWEGLLGPLRRLNLKREAIREMRVLSRS